MNLTMKAELSMKTKKESLELTVNLNYRLNLTYVVSLRDLTLTIKSSDYGDEGSPAIGRDSLEWYSLERDYLINYYPYCSYSYYP